MLLRGGSRERHFIWQSMIMHQLNFGLYVLYLGCLCTFARVICPCKGERALGAIVSDLDKTRIYSLLQSGHETSQSPPQSPCPRVLILMIPATGAGAAGGPVKKAVYKTHLSFKVLPNASEVTPVCLASTITWSFPAGVPTRLTITPRFVTAIKAFPAASKTKLSILWP